MGASVRKHRKLLVVDLVPVDRWIVVFCLFGQSRFYLIIAYVRGRSPVSGELAES